MFKVFFAALALTLGAAGGAHAQTKKELIAKLLQLQQTGIENVGRVLATQTSQRVLQAAGQAIPRVAADKREAVARDVQADVKKFYDDVEPLLRKRATDIAATTLPALYEEKFSEEELKVVIAWLESPVSKKFQQMDGEMASNLAQKVVADTKPAIEPKLKTLEGVLSKRLGVPAASVPTPASGAKK